MVLRVHLLYNKTKMETQNQNPENRNFYTSENWEERIKEHQERNRKGKIFGGILIFIAGAAYLAKEMGVYFPQWVFSWQMFLIIIGLFVGVKNSFRSFGWIVLVGLGAAFMLEDYVPDMHIKIYLWPILIMALGLKMIFRPHRRFDKRWEKHMYKNRGRFSAFGSEKSSSSEDTIDIDLVFSGFRKNIISKDFKGGTISCVFGGGELNLSQADINGVAVLEIKQVFGGVKIIVPANWEVKTDETSAVCGDVSDKRAQQTNANPDKILVVKGSVVFGGIDIRNY
jgi:predicted membrane protein